MSRQRQREQDSPGSPDLFPPTQRQRLIVLDTDDDDTQDTIFPDAQDLLTDESFEDPPSPPPGQVSPAHNNDTEIDYLDRVEMECRDREKEEDIKQSLSPGYLRMLRNMFDDIDQWLENGGGVAPFPQEFKRFARHNWCTRLLPRTERIRVSKLRLRFDLIIIEEEARLEALFWEQAERNELNVRNLNPGCSICRMDLRNESFVIHQLSCGHMFHKLCIDRHLVDNVNKRCPNCMTEIANAGARSHMSYM